MNTGGVQFDAARVRRAVAVKGYGAAPAKECPQCHKPNAVGYATYPGCGYEFPQRDRPKHVATASSEGSLSDQVTRAERDVSEVFYCVHTKRGAPPDAPRTLRVDYRVGFNEYVSGWACVEHNPGEPCNRVVGYRPGPKPPRPDAEEGLPEYVPVEDQECPF